MAGIVLIMLVLSSRYALILASNNIYSPAVSNNFHHTKLQSARSSKMIENSTDVSLDAVALKNPHSMKSINNLTSWELWSLSPTSVPFPNGTDGNDSTTKRPRRELCNGNRKYHKHWQSYMKLICVPCLTILGLTGNILSFLVMGSPVYRRKSYSYYLRALAVFDTLTLLTEAIMMVNGIAIHFGYGPFLHLHTKLTCKLTNFLESVVFLMSSWIVAAFTCDRYVAVCHPLQRARLCTETRAKIVVFLQLLVAMVTQVFRFVYIDQLDRTKPCHSPKHLRMTYFGLDYIFYGFFLRFALPFVIIVSCNSSIIFHVYRMQRLRQTDEREKRRRTNMAITTLFVVSTVFVITLFPNSIIALIQYFKGKDIKTYCTLVKIDVPFQIVRLLNYSTNFALYGMTGRLFRSELHRLLTCRRYTTSPNSSKKIKVKVNFQTVGHRMPAFVATPINTPRNNLHDIRANVERKLYLGRFHGEKESEL